jgi:type VII secretion protein EccB
MVQSRRDHLQAYQFAVERIARAAVAGPNEASSAPGAPLRRSGLGVSIGIVLSVLLCGGCLVYGLISPTPSQAWRSPGAIIVEKETGTSYLLLSGELHPTANYASALLVAGQSASVQIVPRAQLAGIPVGGTIGIPGAPNDVPTATSMLPGAWAICSRQNGGVVLDLDPAGRTAPGPAQERVFVGQSNPADPTDQPEYLVWDSVKYPLSQPSMLSALGLGDQQPSQVAAAWLGALPTGAAVVPPTVPHLGTPGPKVAGISAEVGTLFSTGAGAGEEDYILLSDGLAPITRTEAALFEVTGGASPHQISTAAIAAAPASTNRSMLSALPDFLSGPVFNPGSAALCVRQTAPGTTAGSSVVTETASSVAADPAVVLPADSGMVVEPPGQNPDAANPLIYLITDSGQRYQIDSSNALGALGYTSAPKVAMPASVIALIPAGPDLDVNAAAQAAT